MIESTYLISNKDNYKEYGKFEIYDGFKDLLFEDYNLYKTENFSKENLIEDLYNKNFVNKYDREAQSQIFEQYIDNEAFKSKALFVYSIIDADKFAKFVQENPEIENPNDYTISFSIVDSQGTKVQLYYISIKDIAFVF